MSTIKSIQSELLKLKYPPILWLAGFIILMMLIIVFSAHYLDIHNTAKLGLNPWTRLYKAGQAIFAIFLSVPFIVLLISAALSVEHQNHGFKQLYALPKRRELLLSYKLIALLCVLVTTTIFLALGSIVVGYLLNSILPELEFTYYKLPFLVILKSYAYIMVSLLGVIGIQYFLSLRFKGFLVPASIGVLAYVVGLILTTTPTKLSLYFPYSYPIISRNQQMFDTTFLEIDQLAFLNSVELSSIAVFIFFVLLSLYTERRRNI